MTDRLTVKLTCPHCLEKAEMSPAEARQVANSLLAAADNMTISVFDRPGQTTTQG